MSASVLGMGDYDHTEDATRTRVKAKKVHDTPEGMVDFYD